MQYNINLRALAAEVFGYVPLLRYEIPRGEEFENTEREYERKHSNELYGLPSPPNQDGVGLLGLPVFQQVEFMGMPGFPGIKLDDPIVEVSQDRLIVTTEIQGRNGTIKEYISQGDYAISIKGILASDPKNGKFSRRYPEQEVLALKKVCDVAEALPVTARIFSLLGIHNVVIKSVSWPPLPGFTNLQAYELRCLSDDPIELLT